MATCNDCIHQELCDVYSRAGVTDVPADDISICELFKNKADVVEVRRGKWIKRGNEKKCSECKFIYYSNNDEWNFCPNCSSDMRGKTNDKDQRTDRS